MTRAMLALGALGLVACSSKDPEFAGVGQWRFGHTTLDSVKTGVCQPTELNDGRKGTWCFAQAPFKIAKSVAEVDLYFLGSDKTAPLIEIQLKVRGCHEDEVDQWMRTAFGPPIDDRGMPPGGSAAEGRRGLIDNRSSRAYWKNSFLWAAALLPSEPGRCVVHFLPLSENAEIERIKQL